MLVSSFGNGNKETVDRFCRTHRLKLPQDYREFLASKNGVLFRDDPKLEIEFLGKYFKPNALFGIHPDRRQMDLAPKIRKYGSILPKDSLVIGNDVLDNLLVLIGSGEDAGVYYWDAEAYHRPAGEANAYLVADSFHDLEERLGGFEEMKIPA